MNLPGIKTSEFLLLAVTIVLGFAFSSVVDPLVLAASILGAGLYGVGRGMSKKGGAA